MSFLHKNSDNILEDDNLFPKIADYGLSKILNRNENSMSSQSAQDIKGAPIYIAPEIWTNYSYTEASDVYAFGMILYEIITGDKPFKDVPFPVFYANVVLKGERFEFKYPIPDCYRILIEKCLSRNPSKRPSFKSIAKELKTNEDFIFDDVDEDEYNDYINLIKYSKGSFNKKRVFKTISKTGKVEENQVNIIEDEEDNNSKQTIDDLEDETIDKSFNKKRKNKSFELVDDLEDEIIDEPVNKKRKNKAAKVIEDLDDDIIDEPVNKKRKNKSVELVDDLED
ncbi:hypothetical protein M9Y10_006176 [Tritrichomonas musculus]|uniref:Protein kinase domain-containing protein n=1 Tax=Tritrichomonas musculus TaxID=1915356 RepID=A0ABR2JF74_9EUKA